MKTKVSEEDLPEINWISGPVKTKAGWVAFRATSQGRRIIDEEPICEPNVKAHVLERIKIEVVRRFISTAMN